jgi:hypothetical protein
VLRKEHATSLRLERADNAYVESVCYEIKTSQFAAAWPLIPRYVVCSKQIVPPKRSNRHGEVDYPKSKIASAILYFSDISTQIGCLSNAPLETMI